MARPSVTGRHAGRWIAAAVLIAAPACSSSDGEAATTTAATTPERTSTSSTADASTTSSAGPTSSSAPAPGQTTAGGTPVLTIEVVDVLPHRRDAFTQGLELDDDVLYESIGIVGRSSVAALDASTGRVLREEPVEDVFGEGLTRVGDRLIQLTWQDGIAYVRDADTLEAVGTFRYRGEGWGLCHDGERLVMSDGSPVLAFRDPETFEREGTVTVRLDGAPVEELNELECVGDRVYANIWPTDTIVEIDPATGEVTTVIDASELQTSLDPRPTETQAVLNGIAHDPEAGTFWLTGKLWPQLFVVRFVPRIG